MRKAKASFVGPAADVLDPGDGPVREELQPGCPIERGPELKFQTELTRAGWGRRVRLDVLTVLPEGGGVETEYLAHGFVELSDAGKSGRESDIAHGQAGGGEQDAGQLRAVGAGEGER